MYLLSNAMVSIVLAMIIIFFFTQCHFSFNFYKITVSASILICISYYLITIKHLFFSDDIISVSRGWRDFGTESHGYIDGLRLNVTAESGTLYYVTIQAINGAGACTDIMCPSCKGHSSYKTYPLKPLILIKQKKSLISLSERKLKGVNLMRTYNFVCHNTNS